MFVLGLRRSTYTIPVTIAITAAIAPPMMAELGRAPTPEDEPTVNASVAEWTSDPLVPVTVTV